ncbi:MAG: protein translocase subunit SecD [Phycisphaerales bacterium]|nr:MAG: protein translocase subunit SecD [Phycisphaerales bacterium]
MHDPNRLMKWLLVIGLVVLSLTILYPPHEKLKGGIDLVGGTSLLFEIDTAGLDSWQQTGLSARVMRILRDRVDPQGQLNLEWRPIGNSRLEIRMPRPPKEALRRREAYNFELDAIKAKALTRFDIETALHSPESERDAALAELVRGITERLPLIEALKLKYAAYLEARDGDDLALADQALDAYEEAVSDLLVTNMPVVRLTDILAIPPGEERDGELEKLREEFPSYDKGISEGAPERLITRAVTAHDKWAADKADLEDPSDLKRRIRGAGVLEFRILGERDSTSPANTAAVRAIPSQPVSRYTEQLKKQGPRPKAGDHYVWFPIEKPLRFLRADDLEQFDERRTDPNVPIIEEYAGRYYVLAHNDPEYGLLRTSGRTSSSGRKAWALNAAYPDQDPMTGENVVSFQLDARGGLLFGQLTEPNVNRDLCIMLDDTAVSFANILERITTRCQITGGFTAERVQNLVRTLEAGSLPARLKETPLREVTIGPSLGETNRTKGMQAAIWGSLTVAVFVLIYYGLVAGGMADIALAMNLLFVLAAMALMQATFTLPGIAGLILTVGMAIDANVLIFERIREERDRGVIFKKALNAGYDKAFSTIIDANITTLITCVILGFVGSEEVKGFAITLGIGITTSMFTALFVTRLVFNTLIAKGVLKDLSMRRLIGTPSIDWLDLRRIFWPVSLVVVLAGLGMFIGLANIDKEAVFGIEFLGGTSVQIDLKPGVAMTDEDVADAITRENGGEAPSAVDWLRQAAGSLAAAEAQIGEDPGQFMLTSSALSGSQLGVLMRETLEDSLQRDGIHASGRTATFNSKSGQLDLTEFKAAVEQASLRVRASADRLSGASVQGVGAVKPDETRSSYQIATTETNRSLVQAAVLAALGDKLVVQRAVNFTVVRDEEITRDLFFVVEEEDQFLSDVIGGDANFDVRRFRGGVAVKVQLDETEEPLPREEFERRIREVGLHAEFADMATREAAIFPLGASSTLPEGQTGYKSFAMLGSDESLRYEDDPIVWADGLAKPQLAQVEAALGMEKSLSSVIQFAPQVAGQAQNRAIFAVILALAAVVSYLWLRFGTKEYGFAAIVALVHDVSITLGLVAFSHFVYGTIVGKGLLIDDFKIDLPMIAAILTVIGYSLNDTIVVFDRIRENRGRLGTLSDKLVNSSLNQTLSRTLLTSMTTFLVVGVLYIFGGQGVHGFSFALLIGVIVGTYSSLGVATPLLYRPDVLRHVMAIIVTLGLIGLIFAITGNQTTRWVVCGIVVVVYAITLVRSASAAEFAPASRAARA